MEITSEDDVDLHAAKKIMEDRQKSGELVYDQKICLEYLEKVSKTGSKGVEDLQKELTKISILKPRYVTLIMNILPNTEGEVETLFSKERTNLKKEEIKQIVDTVKKFKK